MRSPLRNCIWLEELSLFHISSELISCAIWLRFWYVGVRPGGSKLALVIYGTEPNAISGFFGFPPKNFISPYLSSPSWQRSHLVLKIIVWMSSVLTNIIQQLRKHIKGTRASDISLIENFEKIQIFPFWTQNPIFLYVKGGKWVWYINFI